jgi:NADP-dependent 3-hydroxy acid dehydrogenase YdfG
VRLERGQVAVVTGASSGLGQGLAEAFAARGLDVVLADVDDERLATATAAVEAMGVSAIGVPTDVRFADQLDALATATLDRFGRVDLICNNAGVASFSGATWQVPLDEWTRVLDINLRGVINGVRAFVPHLVAQGAGHVVNTASMAGISAGPGMTAYLVSKHAVVALSEGLAAELAIAAPSVGVTVVCPGQVATNIAASMRATPTDQANAGGLDAATVAAFREWNATISHPTMPAAEAARIVLADLEAGTLHSLPNGASAGTRAWIERLLADLPPDSA